MERDHGHGNQACHTTLINPHLIRTNKQALDMNTANSIIEPAANTQAFSVWRGSDEKYTSLDAIICPEREGTDDRNISLGAYFTDNKVLAGHYGHVKSYQLQFNQLLNLTGATGNQILDLLPMHIPNRVKGEIIGGYIFQLEPHFVLERLLLKLYLVNQLTDLGYDGIAFTESYSSVFVPFNKAVISETRQ